MPARSSRPCTSRREQQTKHRTRRGVPVGGAAGRDTEKFDLKTFRSTYPTWMLRSRFDVRTVQHWMGQKSLETTMRYLVPSTDVQVKLDLVGIPGGARINLGRAAKRPRLARLR